jgi:hypothetical protein
LPALQAKGFKTITDIGFEDGVSNIEVHQLEGREIRLKINPITGDILR